MKLAALSSAFGLATASAAAGGGTQRPLAPQSVAAAHQPLALAAVDEHESRQGTQAFFGDTICPCIGFDNIEGETTVTFVGDVEAAYPADLGSRCEAWDNKRHPVSCKDKGQKPDWCAKKWCYVDPCNCAIDILPKVSAYIPDARYRGKPLFYSYATCGAQDDFTEKVPQVGSPGCRCVGFDNIPGTTEISFEGGETVAYPAEIGGSCRSWDKKTHPACHGKKPPSWCKAEWCYVDPCSCSLPGGAVPKISAYLPDATFTGKGLYYSYETCKSPDGWTEDHHKVACVNQATKDECDLLERCTWAGKRCLGNELVDHPLCKGLAKKYEKNSAGPHAAPLRGAVALLAVSTTVVAVAAAAGMPIVAL